MALEQIARVGSSGIPGWLSSAALRGRQPVQFENDSLAVVGRGGAFFALDPENEWMSSRLSWTSSSAIKSRIVDILAIRSTEDVLWGASPWHSQSDNSTSAFDVIKSLFQTEILIPGGLPQSIQEITPDRSSQARLALLGAVHSFVIPALTWIMNEENKWEGLDVISVQVDAGALANWTLAVNVLVSQEARPDWYTYATSLERKWFSEYPEIESIGLIVPWPRRQNG